MKKKAYLTGPRIEARREEEGGRVSGGAKIK